MQLTPIASRSVAQPSPATTFEASSLPTVPAAGRVAPAAAGASAPLAGVIDGAALLAPLIDFPGIEAGQVFDIVKGSKVGFMGVKGEATIMRFDDDGASFAVKAGAFGIKVDVLVDVVRTGPDTVRISSTGTGIPNQSAEARIIESRTNFAEFERISDPSEHTVIQHDGAGGIVIDTVVPTFGAAHLILERR